MEILKQKLKSLAEVPSRAARLVSSAAGHPALRAAASGLLRLVLGFVLSGGSLFGWPMPFAVALVAVSGGMLPALAAALGGGAGYLYFWGFTGGLEFLAAGILVFSAACIFREFPLAERTWFMPAAAAVMTALVGFLFLLQARFSPLRVCLYLARIALAAGAAAAFRSAREKSAPGALLFSLACCLSGLTASEIAGGVTVGHVAAAAFAAAAAGTPAGAAVAAVCGLAVDLALRPEVSFCAVLCLSGLACRWTDALPRAGKTMLFLFCCTAAVLATGGRTPEFIPAAAVGGCLSLLIPLNLFRPKTGAVAVGDARERLELAAGTLDELGRLVTLAQPRPDGWAETAAVFDRASEHVCRCCVLWSQCWQQKNFAAYRALCAAARPMRERGSLCREDFPRDFAENCRHLDSLIGAVNQELDGRLGRRQLESRLREGREALAGQYGVLARFLRGASQRMTAARSVPAEYRPELGIRGMGRKGCAVSGDRGACFRTTDGRLFLLLCDGMGTGAEAAAESLTAVRTLTGLLRAGMPAADALSTLNSVYVLRDDGCFSTADLLEVSLISGEATLYKWGSAPSYLHLDGMTKKIGTAAPPPGLGVGDAHKAEEIRLSLCRGELLVLLSDGAGGEVAGQRIAACGDLSPKEVAAAVVANPGADGTDDMTAVALRLRPCSSQG